MRVLLAELPEGRRPRNTDDQQDRMKKCNAAASGQALKGDERKTFMSECLEADKKS